MMCKKWNYLLLLAVSVISANDMKNLENWMDPTVDPCENFYRFTCGGMIAAPPNTLEKSPLPAATDEIEEILLKNLKTDEADETNGSLIRNAKNLFKACIKDLPAINSWMQISISNNEQLKNFLLNEFETVMGGWPLFKGSSWNEDAFDWKRTIAKVNNESFWYNVFFPFDVIMMPTARIHFQAIDIQQNMQTLVESWNSNTSLPLVPEIDDFVALGVDPTRARDETTAWMQFERNLAQILVRTASDGELYVSDRSSSINVTIKNLTDTFPFFPWEDYVNEALAPYGSINLTHEVSFDRDYYDAVHGVYNLIQNTDTRVLANYVAWSRTKHLTKPLLIFDFLLKTTGPATTEQKCLKMVNDFFPSAQGMLLARKYTNQEGWKRRMKYAETIVESVREQVIEMINNATLLSKDLRERSVDTIRTVKLRFGYSEELYNGTIIDKYFKHLITNQSNLIESIINIFFLGAKQIRKQVTEPISSEEAAWQIEAIQGAMPNAFYMNETNSILITLPALGDQILGNGSLESSIKHNRFAYIIGHEFGHTLDPTFVKLQGHDLVSHIWSAWNSLKYSYSVRCLQQLYENIVGSGLIFPEQLLSTMGENVADNLGFEAAYRLHKKSQTNEVDHQTTLHNKTYNRDQMFWISVAGTWCERVDSLRDEMFKLMFSGDDSHSPLELRILGAFSNSQKFADDFQCPVGSPMNPSSKCPIL